MSSAIRRLWVIVLNTSLLLLSVYGIYSEMTAKQELEFYLGPVSVRRAFTEFGREKAWGIAGLILLVIGALNEFRKTRVAVFVNTTAYALIVILFVWGCASLRGHPEHVIPYVMLEGIPSMLLPLIGLSLYRRDIVGMARAIREGRSLL